MRPTLSLLAGAVFFVAVVACSSQPPAAPKPDGRTRHPVNSPESIAAYAARNTAAANNRTKAAPDHPAATTTQTGSAAHSHKQQSLPGTGDTGAATDNENHGAEPVMARQATITLPAYEMLEVRPRSLVFSIPCALGTAICQPSPRLTTLLMRAAPRSTRIEIRGRTDADRPNPAEQGLALRRAQGFKRHLVRQGIDASRLYTSALAAGGHIADNSDADGRARNRRVEIEIMDLDPHPYHSMPTGDDHEPD